MKVLRKKKRGGVVRDGLGDSLKTVIWIFSWVKKKIQDKTKKNNK